MSYDLSDNLSDNLSELEPKIKKTQLDINAPIYVSLIKATHTCCINEQVHKLKPVRSTAVVAVPYYEGQFGLSSSRHHIVPMRRVLLESGSSDDLLFHQAESSTFPYSTRAIPQAWHTSAGIFHTDKQGECEIVFLEFSHSKRVKLTQDVLFYKTEADAPMFDLIIDTETMSELGIIIDFESKLITIDKIELPMRNISHIQAPNTRYQIYKNSFWLEPSATSEMSEITMKILDAKYEKADLPKIIEESCQHLTST